jgi:hypothetical protein
MKSILFVVIVSAAFAVIRLLPGFPAHGVSWVGTYEALAHCWASATCALPLGFWLLQWKAVRSCDGCETNEKLLFVRDFFAPYRQLAWVSFLSSLLITLAVEAPRFFQQVPFPWTLAP